MTVATMLGSLSHQTRIDIVKVLSEQGELNVNEVSEKLRQPQPTTSRHLLILKDAGVVKVRPENTSRIYSLVTGFSGLIEMAESLAG
jgi:DNA-binding transcriptional ArsR family regulator